MERGQGANTVRAKVTVNFIHRSESLYSETDLFCFDANQQSFRFRPQDNKTTPTQVLIGLEGVDTFSFKLQTLVCTRSRKVYVRLKMRFWKITSDVFIRSLEHRHQASLTHLIFYAFTAGYFNFSGIEDIEDGYYGSLLNWRIDFHNERCSPAMAWHHEIGGS